MFPHHTKSKGDLAMFKCQLDLHEKGFLILQPQTEHAPFDVVAYRRDRFYRIQVKYRQMKNGVIYVRFSNSYSTKNGVFTNPIDKSQVDYYCIYCPETGLCYYLNPNQFGQSVTLRIQETKNKQAAGVYYAAQFLTFGDE